MRPERTPTAERTSGHWLDEDRLRVYPRLILVAVAIVLPIHVLTMDASDDTWPAGGDFITFWAAAKEVVEGRPLDAWDLHAHARTQRDAFPSIEGWVTWGYPPPTLLLVAPLGLMSFPVAYVVWVTIGLTGFLLALRPALRGLPHAWPLALTFPGVTLGIASGQSQFFVGVLLGGAVALLPRRPVLAGVLIGLMVVKPQLALLVPVVLVADWQWRAVTAAAVTATTATAVSLLALGPRSLGLWVDSLVTTGDLLQEGVAPISKMVTPIGLLHGLGVPEQLSLVVQAGCSIVVAVVVVQVWRASRDRHLRVASLVVGTFLATPYAMNYDLALLAFAIASFASVGHATGWLRGERNLLVALWILPLVVSPIAVLTHVGVAPLVTGVALWAIRRRALLAAADLRHPTSRAVRNPG